MFKIIFFKVNFLHLILIKADFTTDITTSELFNLVIIANILFECKVFYLQKLCRIFISQQKIDGFYGKLDF